MAVNQNPGPNVVDDSLIRGQSIVSVPSPAGTAAANAVTNLTVPINGVQPGDFVAISPQKAVAAGVTIGSPWVSAAGVVTIPYINATATGAAVASDVYLVNVIRSYPVTTDFGITIANNYGIVGLQG